jgi:tetratricopeptide (TPR) repeat protein
LNAVERTDAISLRSKSRFLEFAVNDKELCAGLVGNAKPSSAPNNNRGADALARAKSLSHNYRMSLECLSLAEDLNRTAFKLEQKASYDMAIKLYREALAIKEKNLGTNKVETIEQSGDIARVYGAKGDYKQSGQLYEQVLVSFRRLKDPGDGYITVLENYVDMLNRSNQADKAVAILNELKKYRSELHPRSDTD